MSSYLTITGPRGIKKDILRLRSEGKTYSQIAKELNCSRGTIAYHCNKAYQKSVRAKVAWNRKNNIKTILANKLCRFKTAKKPATYSHEKARTQIWNRTFKNKVVRLRQNNPFLSSSEIARIVKADTSYVRRVLLKNYDDHWVYKVNS